MKHVYTQEELTTALKNGETCTVHGEIAEKIISKYKKQKAAKWGGLALAAIGLLAIPFTGGASSGLAVSGAIASLTLEISAAELAILLGGTAAIYGIHKNFKVEFKPDGTVVVTPK